MILSSRAQIDRTISSLVKVKDGDSIRNTNIRFYIIGGDTDGHFQMMRNNESRNKNIVSAGIKVKSIFDPYITCHLRWWQLVG